MKLHGKKIWPSLVTIASVLVGFLTPSVNAYAATHKPYAAAILCIWGVLLHSADSPVARTPTPEEAEQK